MTLAARASASLSITLASLAASSTLTVGRCSAAYDNSANLDELLPISGKFKTGAANLQAGLIEVWAFAERADGTWPELFTAAYTGADGGFTVTERNVLQAGAALVCAIPTSTSQRDWVFRPRDLSMLLGGAVRKAAVFVTHSAHTSTNVWSATAGDFDISIKPHYWA